VVNNAVGGDSLCRMIGFSYPESRDIGDLVDHLKHMAEKGMKAPHSHGWGIYVTDGENVFYYKTMTPVYEDVDVHLEMSLGILHARKASDNVPVTPLQLQPFISPDGVIFCHNGTIKTSERANVFSSDSYDYFLNVREFADLDDLVNRLRSFLRVNRYSGANFLMLKSSKLYVFCAHESRHDYYTLWYNTDDGFVVTSEPRDTGGYTPMENGELLVVERGKVIARIKGVV